MPGGGSLSMLGRKAAKGSTGFGGGEGVGCGAGRVSVVRGRGKIRGASNKRRSSRRRRGRGGGIRRESCGRICRRAKSFLRENDAGRSKQNPIGKCEMSRGRQRRNQGASAMISSFASQPIAYEVTKTRR